MSIEEKNIFYLYSHNLFPIFWLQCSMFLFLKERIGFFFFVLATAFFRSVSPCVVSQLTCYIFQMLLGEEGLTLTIVFLVLFPEMNGTHVGLPTKIYSQFISHPPFPHNYLGKKGKFWQNLSRPLLSSGVPKHLWNWWHN